MPTATPASTGNSDAPPMKTILQIALGLLTLSAARLSLHGQTITASAGGSAFSSSATSVDDLDDFTFDFQGDKAKIERYTIFESPYYRYDDPTTEAEFPSQFDTFGDRQPKTEEQIISYSESYSQGEIKMLDYSKTTHSLQLVASKPMPQAVTIKFLRFNTIPVVDSMNPALYYEPSENDSWGHFATNPAYVGNPNPEKYKYDKFETLELSIPAGGTKSNSFELEAPTAIDINSQILSGVSNSLGVEAHTIASQSVIRAGLRVDQNRDGRMTTTDLLTNTAEKPFRFWSNDDDDIGPAAGDNMPGQPANLADYNNTTVDSVRDLVDFFPVYFDIKQLITVLPPSDSIKYKLKQADGALNFVYTNLTKEYDASEKRSKAYDYQYKVLTSGFGPAFTQAAGAATTQQITAAGVELNTAFLDGIKNNEWGVVLIEGRVTSDKPLVLAVEKDGTEIAEVSVNIKISPVEKMFRHVNLAGSVKEYNGTSITPPRPGIPTNTAQPTDYPDNLTNGKYFVFLHGFNVDADSARGWNAEIFKRMHLLGSKARFVGVQWNGSPPLPALIAALAPRKYLDYHKAVFQALQTGDLLAGALNFTNGADVTVAAHSLGNIVTSHAIQNGGFTPTRYYMINAASPIEAYSLTDSAGQFDIMRHEDWVDYEPRLYASKWHELFAASDNRSALTWKNRFVSVRNRTVLHNFHSGQEDVVANGDQITSASILKLANEGNLDEVATGEFSWKLQELVKGNYLTSSASGLVIERRQGGWEFNVAWDNLVVLGNQADLPPEQTVNKVIINGIVYDSQPLQPNEASSITNEELKTKPFFRDFDESDLINPNATIASAKAGETKVKYDTLARAIPAMSHAVAANRLESLDSKNYDMPTLAKKNGWYDAGNRWRHSDFYAVALPYVYPMFQEMISRGELNK